MEFITVQQAANNFDVSVRTIQKWAKEGKILGAKRVGHVWLIPEDAVLKIENVQKICFFWNCVSILFTV